MPFQKYQGSAIVVRCAESDDDAQLILVLEYCNGGNLRDFIEQKGGHGRLRQKVITKYLLPQLKAGYKAMYDKNIVHRDIKLENIFLSHPEDVKNPDSDEITFKYGDFGFARCVDGHDVARATCGTPRYYAPEILYALKNPGSERLRYRHEPDMWAIGVVLWYCLMGEFPFSDDEIENNYLDEKLERLPSLFPAGTEEELRKLILALLKKDPVERMPVKDFCGGSTDSGMEVSMSPSNHLNQSTKSNSSQNAVQQVQPSNGLVHGGNFSYNGQVPGAIVIHQHTHIYNSGVPQQGVNYTSNQALEYKDNYNRQPSQSSLSTSPLHSTPPHSSPSRSRRGLTFRHHPYDTSFSPRRRGSSNSSQDQSQNRSHNRSQNHSQRQSLNGSLNYEFPPPAPVQTNGASSQISNSYQSTPMLPWPSEQIGNSTNNPSTNANQPFLNQNLPQNHSTINTSSQHNSSFSVQNQALPANSVANDENPPPQQSDNSNAGFFGILGKIWPFKS